MDRFMEQVNHYTDLIGQWITQWIEIIAKVLADWGVPEPYQLVGALGVLYVAATLLVVLVILLLLRLARRRSRRSVDIEPVEFEEEPIIPSGPEVEPEVAVPPVEEAAEKEILEREPAEKPAPVAEKAPEAAPATLFDRMRSGLAKTHSSLIGRIDTLLGGSNGFDDDLSDELEEILITADFGMKTTTELTDALRKRCAREQSPEVIRNVLKDEIRAKLRLEASPLDVGAASPFVIMVIGVNGVGKTTTIGKLAHQFTAAGKKVLLGAADTFRAAASEQLAVWGERSGVDVIRHGEGADPAAVVYDAARAAVSRNVDILILDTAGRLHTKVNLMEEMKKIRRVLAREIPGAPHESLLVLDATTGQNALIQAKMFHQAVELSGIALTKLDGTAKGGMVVAIGTELNLPVRFVGIGEGIEDLRPFDPDVFTEALFQRD